MIVNALNRAARVPRTATAARAGTNKWKYEKNGSNGLNGEGNCLKENARSGAYALVQAIPRFCSALWPTVAATVTSGTACALQALVT
jgi:hypothetical protein